MIIIEVYLPEPGKKRDPISTQLSVENTICTFIGNLY